MSAAEEIAALRREIDELREDKTRHIALLKGAFYALMVTPARPLNAEFHAEHHKENIALADQLRVAISAK